MTTYEEFPDATAAVAWAIREAVVEFEDRVYSFLPRDQEFPLCVVQRIGGVPVERHRLDGPNIQVSVWGTNQSEAHDLAQAARSAVHEMEGGAFGAEEDCPVDIVVAAVADNFGLSFQPDAATSKDRYIFAVSMVTHVGADTGS